MLGEREETEGPFFVEAMRLSAHIGHKLNISMRLDGSKIVFGASKLRSY
jgi:hypothetical protein